MRATAAVRDQAKSLLDTGWSSTTSPHCRWYCWNSSASRRKIGETERCVVTLHLEGKSDGSRQPGIPEG
jgi:hypothetical protein